MKEVGLADAVGGAEACSVPLSKVEEDDGSDPKTSWTKRRR
jgi:hypothetical protein